MKTQAVNWNPLVSVITPAYNRAGFIVDTIESVLSQTYSNFELIIIDDGSTDNTEDVVRPYLSDARVRYYYQENKGLAGAKNGGLAQAKGELVCVLDSDNMWYETKLKDQVDILRNNPDIDILYGDNQLINEDGDLLPTESVERYSGYITNELLIDNYVGINSAMVRRSCFESLGWFNDALRRSDDYELWLRFSVKYRFLHVPKTWVKYRVMDGQLSSNKEGRLEANKKILELFIAANPERVSEKRSKYTWCRFYTRRGRIRANKGELKLAFLDYLKAMSYCLYSKYPWRAMAKLIIKRTG